MITFYYGKQPKELWHLIDKVTTWLPEHLPPTKEIWTDNQINATTDLTYLHQIQARIQVGTLQPDNIIWIEIKNRKAIGHIFGANGQVSNIFRVI